MNPRLADAVSPYLRAHADDPVAWFPWGQDAFDEAARRDVPVLVSIGYATCHWCHVMARESFRDAETAARLNADFVCIKVDREEHPDIDAAFLAAAAAFTQQLGWPLTAFASPDGGVFFAATYLPPTARAGLPAFRDVLSAVTEAWTDRREGVRQAGDAVRRALAQAAPERSAAPRRDQLDAAARTLAAGEDVRCGGFASSAAKFPIATALRFLQDRDTPADTRALVPRALAAMRGSELFDEVEGGFFRYATNPDWTEPHYERMLIDNAQLLDVATAAGDRDTAAALVGFLTAVLQQPEGGFGAAQDAESIIDGIPSAGGYFALDRAARREVEPPAVDDKIVTGWNGLAIAALVRYAVRFSAPDALATATAAAHCVLTHNRTASGWVRASRSGVPSGASATRADLATLASGLFALAGATGEAAWAVAARDALDTVATIRSDAVLDRLGLFAPGESDGDEPSGAAAVADAAATAWAWGAGERFHEVAVAAVEELAEAALAQPRAYGAVLGAARRLSRPPRQVVVVAEDALRPLARAAALLSADVFACVTADQAAAMSDAGFAVFDGRGTREDSVWICDGFTCDLPITDPALLPSS